VCGMNSSGSTEGLFVGSCVDSNETSGAIK
jgi:hypothetical protein